MILWEILGFNTARELGFRGSLDEIGALDGCGCTSMTEAHAPLATPRELFANVESKSRRRTKQPFAQLDKRRALFFWHTIAACWAVAVALTLILAVFVIFESGIDRQSCHPDVNARLQGITFEI